jgi:hypothetical protein
MTRPASTKTRSEIDRRIDERLSSLGVDIENPGQTRKAFGWLYLKARICEHIKVYGPLGVILAALGAVFAYFSGR